MQKIMNMLLESKSRARLLLLALVAGVAGCGEVPAPHFRLNMQGRDPNDFKITGSESKQDRESKQAKIKGQQDIVNALYAMFGTPDEPFVFEESGLDINKIRLAAGRTGGNQDGTQRGLFRQHCVHCHGISGDGAGPTAAFLVPYPRDYRRGIFKYKATQRGDPPSAADLAKLLREGIPGTAMPSFTLLPADEIDALVEYVRYLSLRGEVETGMAIQVYDAEEPLEMTRSALVDAFLATPAEMWAKAEKSLIKPPAHPSVDTPEKLQASIAAGRVLFLGGKAQCTKCHGPNALGDGSDVALFDDWNKDKKVAETEKQIHDPKTEADTRKRLQRTLASWLLPEQEIKPRNLRLGVYHGGRSPADIYRRIHAGINGTPMPATGANPATLKPEEIWHIVDYVRSLPYEAMSLPQVGETTVNKPQL
ncbi:MAG TPA: c-type cytochrome [Pirellulales bacterium]